MNQRTVSIFSTFKTLISAIVAWAALVGFAHAQTVVLVPGYLGDVGTWRNSGVAYALATNGWHDAGHIIPAANAPRFTHQLVPKTKQFYTVDLPTEAPLRIQANVLAVQLDAVRQRHANDELVIIGHSAGGVIARLAMVQRPDLNVSTLISIAAPHLGTGLAELGLDVAESPVGWFAPFFGGGTINRSQALYHDLVRERPGSLLFSLNRSQHPSANYISVVRTEWSAIPGGGWKDEIVAPYSQDMNNVAALKGRSRIIRSPLEHFLHPADGGMIVRLLNEVTEAKIATGNSQL